MVGSTTSDKIKIETLEPSKEIEERRTKTVIVMKTSKLEDVK
nr:Bm1096 [Brugia malayi]